MLITLEGCDGVGKSTLVERITALADESGIKVKRLARGKPEHDDPFVEYERDLLDYDPSDATQLVLCDRWAWGETIYGPIFRGESMLDLAGLRHVDLFLRSRGALQVLVDAFDHVVWERVEARGDKLITPSHVPNILRLYRKLAVDIGLHVRHVYTNTSVNEVDWDLFISSSIMAEEAARLPRTQTYVGPVEPEILLVGEKRGDGPMYENDLPAFTPRRATSGHYLMSALEEAGCTEYGMVNALEDDVAALYSALRNPPVVTLGNTAKHELERLRIPHGSVQHPQYVRRFFHGRSEEYASMIQQAARTGEHLWLK